MNPLLALAVQGFFVGMGSVTAAHFYSLHVKDRLDKFSLVLKRLRKGKVR